MKEENEKPVDKKVQPPRAGYVLQGVVLFFLLLAGFTGNGQPSATGISSDKPLSEVLDAFSRRTGIRFAYDAVSFKELKTDVPFNRLSIDQFLGYLHEHHRIVSKKIDGTWLLILPKAPGTPPDETEKKATGSLQGYVRDRQTGENLAYCNVAAEGYHGGMTNELGFFHFSLPASDSIRVMVSHLGYQRLDTVVPLNRQVLFLLKPSAIMMSDVSVVHWEKEVLQASPRPEKIAFNPLKASAIPRIANDDMGNALLLIPGIEFFQGGLSGLSVRGSDPADNLVLLDGIPVLETSHLLGNMSVLNSKFIQQAFVSRGGFGAAYGDRVSGLIELTGKSGKKNKPYLDLSANLLNTNFLVNVPVTPALSVTAAWRRSFIDRWQNYLYFRLIDDVISSEENPVTSTIIPQVSFQDVNAKISFHPRENVNADLNLLYGKDNQSRDFELLRTKDFYRNERMQGKNIGLSFNFNWQANARWFHSFSTGFSMLDKSLTDETGELQTYTETVEVPGKGKGNGKGVAKTRENTYTRETYDIDNGVNQVEAFRTALKTQLLTGRLTSEAGVGFTSNRYSYRFMASRQFDDLQVDSISNDAALNLFNAFFQQHLELDLPFRLRWGMRTNYDPVRNRFFWQPRGALEFIPEKDLKVYVLSGIYYQFLSGIRRFDSEGRFSRLWYLPGKEGEGVVSGTHFILGGKYDKNGWYLDVEAYSKRTRGKMNLFAQHPQQENNQVITYAFRESEERNRGIDLFLQKKHFIFNHMAAYSVSENEEKMNGLFGNEWFPGYNDRTHRLKLTEMVNWNKWTLTFSWQHASGLPVYRYVPDQEVETFSRSGSFSQVNVALLKTLKSKYFSFTAGASLLNVFNRPNIVEVNYLRFSSDIGSMTVRSDISALGTTPVFFMSFKF